MNKKDIINLLLPNIMSVIVAAALIFLFFKIHHLATDVSSDQQLFERFVDDVKSGKQQLTTDRAIAIIGQERDTVAAWRTAIAAEAGLLRFLAGVAIAGIGLQVFVVFQVRKKSRKLQ